jgi:hypothetical protein
MKPLNHGSTIFPPTPVLNPQDDPEVTRMDIVPLHISLLYKIRQLKKNDGIKKWYLG